MSQDNFLLPDERQNRETQNVFMKKINHWEAVPSQVNSNLTIWTVRNKVFGESNPRPSDASLNFQTNDENVARLISAAPEMLSALKAAYSVMSNCELQDSAYSNSRKIVSQAINSANPNNLPVVTAETN